MKKIILSAAIIFIFVFLSIPLVKADYTLEVDYPTIAGQTPTTNLIQFIRYIYLFALSIVGIAAFGALVYGGFQYLLSAGSVGSAEEAKKWMWGAIYGLVLALAAVLILRTINPDLINLKGPTLPPIQPPAATPSYQIGNPPQTGVNVTYQWKKTSECQYIYNDSDCAGTKPGSDYCCCGDTVTPTY